MKTGITGATGQLGRLVVENLKKKVAAENLVALVRTPEKASDLGIETRAFDYEKPESLAEALHGIDHLLLISSNEIGKRRQQHENVIKAAQQAGVKWIVYTSLLHADRSTLSLAGEHKATEDALKASGIAYTILRNGWYTENYTGSVPGAVKAGVLVGSAGEGKISSATREDFAEAAAVVVTSENQQGKVYELAGDDYFTLTDLAAEISRQTGKEIPYKNLPETEYAEMLKSFGLPEGMAKAIASFDTGASKNDLFDDNKQLSRLIGRPTTPLIQSVKDILGQ
ncbi:triphenylmethane reductase (TMR)-like proteins [Proteiniphilum saccharofermentans]|uniref:Triphenylmethane reductase (TMR)-like proteins n=1 Tax=Proteiniphilum saccharofermentans TaxID=1642647 RepID=A0A1R3T4V4_9BACT|nr:SDR family oxidoreductase [Proteiniphilum saccharofermentans]SCD19617.1 triphenylmethane reductase (TMR)-like proteins [Proteiniphilum saccharofermentans]